MVHDDEANAFEVDRDAPAITRLFYETVRSVNRVDYSEQQVEAWAPAIPDAGKWHARMAGSKTLIAEEAGEVVGFCELEKDGHLDMFYLRKDAVGRSVGRLLYEATEQVARGWNLERVFTEASVTAPSSSGEAFASWARGGSRVRVSS